MLPLVLLTQTKVVAGAVFIGDPIAVSKQILKDDPLPWSPDEYASVLKGYDIENRVQGMDRNYLLLQSPWLGIEYLQEVFSTGNNTIPVEQLLDLLNQASNSPRITSRKLAEVSLQQALIEYAKAYKVANDLNTNKSVAYEDAIAFLTSRFGYLKIQTAKKLLKESSEAEAMTLDKKTSKRIGDHLKKIRKQYSEEIPVVNALKEVEIFYTLLEDVVSGLAAIPSYRNFTQTITELNEVQIRERKHWRSSFEITYPTNGTVYTIPDEAEIKWESDNMPKDKTIKFYLLKDNTVIHELGTFNNNAFAGGIRLNRALPAGSNYKIMGIEMFPTDKFHTAKFATPYFTINKRPPNEKPAPKEVVVVAEEQIEVVVEPQEIEVAPEVIPEVIEPPIEEAVEVIAEVEPPKEEIVPPAPEEITEVVPEPVVVETPKPVAKRINFDGRKITYVKELEVNSKIIQISLWDHGRQDGDIVSIYLNGEAIVHEYTLTYQKKGFELNLDPSKPNDLFLYAHNLGKFPPNTVSIEVIDGENSENIILNSDLSRCEAVLINVKK